VLGLEPLAPVAQIMRMLGDSASPVALFTIGAVLFRAGNHVHSRTPVRRYLPVALLKLVVHPALVFGLGLAGPRPRRAGADVRVDDPDPDGGAAEREQRVDPGRALRCRQRPGDPDHHGLDHPRLRHLLGDRVVVRKG
jgi:hypothetical protein